MKYSISSALIITLLLTACQQKGDASSEATQQQPAEILSFGTPDTTFVATGNPIVRHKHVGDPAAMVYGGQVWIYGGVDECPEPGQYYLMNQWAVFSTSDFKTFNEYPCPLRASDFAWSKGEAWASQVIERDGKFYWYVTVENNESDPGKCVAVAVADSPAGPFHDALGKPLVKNSDTAQPRPNMWWDDIDPTVFIDDNGQAYLYWGNSNCYWAKLKDNMIELDGEIHKVDFIDAQGQPAQFIYTEAPWLHKRGGWYYLSFAQEWPEKLGYAMSKSPEGPWEYKGLLAELSGNSNTSHEGIFEFNGEWYMIYHNGALPDGCGFRRSVCIDRVSYNADGTLQKFYPTSQGVQ